MQNKKTKASTQLITLQPGIYILGLKDPDRHHGHLSLGLYPAPSDTGEVAFFVRGDKNARSVAFLQHQHEEVVVRVRHIAAQVLLVEFADEASGSLQPIAIKIDRLEPKAAADNDQKTPSKQSVGADSRWLALKGRFANGADFNIAKGIVGSPDATEAIASFGVDGWNLPPGVELTYTCRKPRSNKQFSASAGNVVGSGSDDPIVSVSFSATDAHGVKQDIEGHVVFAGHPPSAIVSDQEMSGPTGREVLVALRLAVTPTNDQPGSPPGSVWHDPVVLKSKSRKPQKG